MKCSYASCYCTWPWGSQVLFVIQPASSSSFVQYGGPSIQSVGLMLLILCSTSPSPSVRLCCQPIFGQSPPCSCLLGAKLQAPENHGAILNSVLYSCFVNFVASIAYFKYCNYGLEQKKMFRSLPQFLRRRAFCWTMRTSDYLAWMPLTILVLFAYSSGFYLLIVFCYVSLNELNNTIQ